MSETNEENKLDARENRVVDSETNSKSHFSHALLSSALISDRPRRLLGEVSQKTAQLLRELSAVMIQVIIVPE